MNRQLFEPLKDIQELRSFTSGLLVASKLLAEHVGELWERISEEKPVLKGLKACLKPSFCKRFQWNSDENPLKNHENH